MHFDFIYVIFMFVYIVNCQYVSIQAPTQVNYHRDKLPFACIPSGVGGTDSINDITLQKSSSTAWLDVVKVYLDTSTGQIFNKVTWTDNNMSNRASFNISVVSPSAGAGLRIEISADNVACNDEGNYRCSISGNRAGGGKLDSQSTPARVGLLVQANSIESLQLTPRMPENIYNPGTAVTLTCTGDVGNPAGDLRWCIRREGIDTSFTGYPNSADIIQEPATLSGCQYRRSSKLTYNVTSNIPEVDFRCETGPMATCGLSSTLAANLTFTRRMYTELSNTSSQSDSESPGAVVGGVLGGTTVIIAIVLVLIMMRKQGLVMHRRKEIFERQQTHTVLSSSISHENEISRIPDFRQTVAERSYESLGVKGMTNVYDQLTEEKDINTTYQTLGEKEKPNVYDQLTEEKDINSTYQTLGEKEKPNVYDQLTEEKDITTAYQTLGEKEKPNVYEQLPKETEINSTYQILNEKEKPNVYDDLSNQSELDNDEYVNINI